MPDKFETIARALFPDDYHDGTDCRAEVGNEGAPCRHCAYRREEWLKRVASVKAAIEAAHVPADPAADALRRAESFIAGFEDDETQEGIPELLEDIRAAIAGAPADPLRDAAGDMLATLVDLLKPGRVTGATIEAGRDLLARLGHDVRHQAEGRADG